MAKVEYTVDFIEGVWKVGLMGRHFGPYSSMAAAMTAASNAGRKAEVQGYKVQLTINSPREAEPDGAA